jgi:hypothetical protein
MKACFLSGVVLNIHHLQTVALAVQGFCSLHLCYYIFECIGVRIIDYDFNHQAVNVIIVHIGSIISI